eukprot:6179292-Pleurochrysis_carterae.AAC.2
MNLCETHNTSDSAIRPVVDLNFAALARAWAPAFRVDVVPGHLRKRVVDVAVVRLIDSDLLNDIDKHGVIIHPPVHLGNIWRGFR